MKWIVRNGEENHEVDVERVPEGFEVVVGTERRRVDIIRLDGAVASLRYIDDGRSFSVSYQKGPRRRWRVAVGERDFDLETLTPVEAIEAIAAAASAGPSRLTAPIPGKVVKVHVAVGDEVEAGQPLIVLEAMKMENNINADRAGTVSDIKVAVGTTVGGGDVVVVIS